jgi:hypothetical protein
MARAGGTAGGGMGGGPDSAPGGSSASGPGTDGPGNAPGEGMGAGAFGGGGGAQSSREKSAQAFREAIARAMGVTAATPSPMSPEKSAAADIAAQLNARDEAAAAQAAAQAAQESRDPAYRDAAVEAQVMGSSVGSPSVNLDNAVDPANLGFNQGTDDADAIGKAMQENRAFLDDREAMIGAASPSAVGVSLDDPQGTEEGLNQAQVAADTLGARSSRPSAHPSRDTRIGMPFGVGRPALTDQKQNVEQVDQYGRVALIENKFENNPVAKKAAYDKLREYAKANIERGTTLGKAIEAALSFLGPMSMMNNIGKVMDLAMTKAGFTTDSQLNAIGLAIRDAQEVSTQGARGAGGTSVGSINDGRYISMLESGQLDYVEPWMKGLSDQQIQYYFDRPSELEWVRTTWSKAFGLPSKYNN